MSETISPTQHSLRTGLSRSLAKVAWAKCGESDPKLGRDVAIKVFPATLSADKRRKLPGPDHRIIRRAGRFYDVRVKGERRAGREQYANIEEPKMTQIILNHPKSISA